MGIVKRENYDQVGATPEEIEAVRQQYEGTEQWMKAPNDEPTNLTERQWLLVRTPSFKEWFGDWENDPENASKVVDENGEPLVVHHASKKQFEEFITKNKWGYGAAHFSTEPVRNDWYGNVRYMVFINSKNPLIVNAENRMYDSIPFEGKNYDTFGLAALARERGNDGVIINDVKEFGGTQLTNDILVLEPNQIKSATDNNGNFDANDANIYHQMADANRVDRTEGRNRLKADVSKWTDTITNLPRKIWHKNSKNYKKLIHVMDTPLVLQICGIPNLPMYIKQGKINQIRMVDHPEITDEILAQVPGAMTNPIAVINSATRPGSSIIEILSLKGSNNINIIVPVEFETKRDGIDINLISSAYEKGYKRLNISWYNNVFSDLGNVLYINEKKLEHLHPSESNSH